MIMTKNTALKFLYWCRKIHRDYANEPKLRRGNVGNEKHHLLCVKKYTELIHFIREKNING